MWLIARGASLLPAFAGFVRETIMILFPQKILLNAEIPVPVLRGEPGEKDLRLLFLGKI